MSDCFKAYEDAALLVVEPGFNAFGDEPDQRALVEPGRMEVFDPEFQKILQKNHPFLLVLGKGFENDPARPLPCLGLASIEQLRLLKSHGMKRIVMARPHGTLMQNARAINIDVIVGGN